MFMLTENSWKRVLWDITLVDTISHALSAFVKVVLKVSGLQPTTHWHQRFSGRGWSCHEFSFLPQRYHTFAKKFMT